MGTSSYVQSGPAHSLFTFKRIGWASQTYTVRSPRLAKEEVLGYLVLWSWKRANLGTLLRLVT